jgi:hypothetical protein
MAKVKFKAGVKKGELAEYHGFRSDAKTEDVQSRAHMIDARDGEVIEICEADARRLTRDFPAHFSAVKTKARAPAKAKEEKPSVKKP